MKTQFPTKEGMKDSHVVKSHLLVHLLIASRRTCLILKTYDISVHGGKKGGEVDGGGDGKQMTKGNFGGHTPR